MWHTNKKTVGFVSNQLGHFVVHSCAVGESFKPCNVSFDLGKRYHNQNAEKGLNKWSMARVLSPFGCSFSKIKSVLCSKALKLQNSVNEGN